MPTLKFAAQLKMEGLVRNGVEVNWLCDMIKSLSEELYSRCTATPFHDQDWSRCTAALFRSCSIVADSCIMLNSMYDQDMSRCTATLFGSRSIK